MFSSVDDSNPPRTTTAIGLWISLPDAEPFRIIGNVYFVGTFQASCHLIETEEGLILIDPGYSNTLYLVIRSIYELGFNPKDIK